MKKKTNSPRITELKESNLDKSLKLIVKTSFIVFIGLVLSKILGYAYRIIIARQFGPEVYGLFSLTLTVTGFFGSIASLGYSAGLLRYIPLLRAKNKSDEIRYLYKKTLRSYLILGIIFSLLLFFTSSFIATNIFHNESLNILLKIMSVVTILSMLTDIYIVTIRAFEEIGWYSFLYNIFQNVMRVGVLGIIAFMGISSGANPVVWSYVIGSFLTLIASYLVCRYKIKQIFSEYKKKDYSKLSKDFFHYSWPIVFFGIVSIIFYWIDSFSIGYYKSALEVGLYNAAAPIAMLLAFIPEIFMQLFFPLITREYSNKNYKLIEQLSKQVTKWIFMATLPIFILVFFFPGAALNILFGPDYIPAQEALRFLLVGSFISAIFIVSSNLISMLGKSKLVFFNMAIAAALNFVLNMVLVPAANVFGMDNSNGLIGASISTLISIIFLNILFMVQTKRYLSFIPLRRKMITIAIISLIPTFILFYVRSKVPINLFSIILIAGFFVLLYGLLILITHSLDKNDWMIIKSLKKKVLG